ncbi:MAG TPA: hypothetical protein VFX12_05690 [Vicinamibacterales bacterium]|nr:hypothetical protein [Vicinamibacterales bacterium]
MRRLICSAFVVVALGLQTNAAEFVPFTATWSGVTVAVDASALPIVSVVALGEGEGTHLGHFTMRSPHLNNVETFELWGTQEFTAANGDTVTATFAGHLTPNADGSLSGTLPCVITGGTGRFAGATGTYDFTITAVPLADGSGYASTATIDGRISSVGSLE